MTQSSNSESTPAKPYERGSMDISDQTNTWKAFAKMSKWGTLLVLGFTFFLIFWLVGGMSFFVSAGLIAVMVAVLAWFFE